MEKYSISVEKPYSIIPHLHRFSLSDRPLPCIVENNLFWRLIPIEDIFIPVKAEIHEDIVKIDVASECENDYCKEVLSTVRHLLAVDISYSNFLKTLEDFPRLYKMAITYSGLRPARNLNLYEALIKIVLQQRISLKYALNTTAKLIEKWGIREKWNGYSYYSFPPPEKLMRISTSEIKALGTTTVKAKSLLEIAKMEYNGDLPSIYEVNKNPEEYVKFLTGIYGVGMWTAELSVATVIHDYSIAPAGDLNVRKAFSKFLGLQGEKEIREYTEKFGKWKGLIMYLMTFDL
ncbi:DNA-3-methyladenine glycosylase [Candidatus Aciduliprofundum boonei]|uniref:DNA-3-methyladenine glycosylase family protein n=1 Tax=Candidatus Aciduliprofundum boonei TaxID=379547 RepID=UPI00018046A4|nr:DNA-3-methyladenine glycosylase [Candidatus Aciduliprofundum boonei]EDY35556.1 base excision DNA repair protein, HhH-GPD family [Aciduliprofundum boonei T469]HII54539.1 DNA-3-methyladenine glycosylase 2 family protein [Candidatus Aciduliprofundum boonei]